MLTTITEAILREPRKSPSTTLFGQAMRPPTAKFASVTIFSIALASVEATLP